MSAPALYYHDTYSDEPDGPLLRRAAQVVGAKRMTFVIGAHTTPEAIVDRLKARGVQPWDDHFVCLDFETYSGSGADQLHESLDLVQAYAPNVELGLYLGHGRHDGWDVINGDLLPSVQQLIDRVRVLVIHFSDHSQPFTEGHAARWQGHIAALQAGYPNHDICAMVQSNHGKNADDVAWDPESRARVIQAISGAGRIILFCKKSRPYAAEVRDAQDAAMLWSLGQ